jgi:hypothetical protein
MTGALLDASPEDREASRLRFQELVAKIIADRRALRPKAVKVPTGAKIIARSEASWVQQGITNYDGSQFTFADYCVWGEAQGWTCALTGVHNDDLYPSRLHVDHDHATGIVRGLVTKSANATLGSSDKKIRQGRLDDVPEPFRTYVVGSKLIAFLIGGAR